MRVPDFQLYQHQPIDVPHVAQQVHYPCVVKPLALNGSRGVIRADDADNLSQRHSV